MSIMQRAIAEEHHLADIAREGYAPATLPIVFAAIFLALLAVVGVALGVSVAVYYWV
jgi:hypothetical protein